MGEIKKEFFINNIYIPDFCFTVHIPGLIKLVIESYGSSGIEDENFDEETDSFSDSLLGEIKENFQSIKEQAGEFFKSLINL